MSKKIYDSNSCWTFKSQEGKLLAAYVPNNNIDDTALWAELMRLPFTRVIYISKYGKINRTPRFTWAYGQVNPNLPDPDIVSYRDLDFQSEIMPSWLESLSKYCRFIVLDNWGFDPGYNSVIIGRYDDGDDSIGFHEDTETFLAHHFCANVTLGYSRDFQFKTISADGTKQTHEIKLGHKSIFFFNGLEHALPKRAGVKSGEIRFSISFRNMKNNIGIGNSFYYCRGLEGAINNEAKVKYLAKMREIQEKE